MSGAALDTSDVIRAWIWNRDQMHVWVAISVGLGGDELSARMTRKVPWEPELVEDIRRVLGVPEDEFWDPPTGQLQRSRKRTAADLEAAESS